MSVTRLPCPPPASAANQPGAPLRVLLAATELGVGGAERCLTRLALGLDRRRFAVEVVSLAPAPLAERRELVDQLAAAAIPVHFLDLTSPWQAPVGYRRLRRLLRERRPQVVQTFLYHANVLTALAARRLPLALLAGLRVAQASRWRNATERWALRRAEQIVCVSEEIAQHAAARGLPRDRLVVIPNGVEIERFADAAPADLTAWGIGAAAEVVLFVGRLDPQKGLDQLLPALGPALSAAPNRYLAIAGDGPQRSELERLAAQSPAAGRIVFLGWRDDLPALYSRASLVALPSRYEGMPNVLLEAMAAGRPVVARRVEGVAEVLGTAAAEQSVAGDDIATLVEQIAALLADPTTALRLGNENRRRIAAQFSAAAMIDRYAELFQRLAPHKC